MNSTAWIKQLELNSLNSIVQSQQQKTKERFGGSLHGGMVGGFVGASIFGWFLVGFGLFLLVEGDFRWFQVVSDGFRCFNSYTNFTAYRRVNSLLYSWTRVTDWGRSIFLFKVKQQEKDYCCLVTEPSENKWLFPIFCFVLCQIKNFF